VGAHFVDLSHLLWLAFEWSGITICSLGATLHLMGDGGRTRGPGDRLALEIGDLLESIPELAIVLNRAGNVVEANSAASQLIGESREGLRGMPAEKLAELLQVSDGVRPVQSASSTVARALKGERVLDERRILRHPRNNSSLEVLVSASPIRTRKGEVAGVLVIARDITELATLQRRMAEMERHHAIGQMAAALAHDFNNVLDTISQAAAVLEISQEKSPSERREVLGMIRTAVRRGAEIIGGVREYLRTGTGETGPIDLRQVLIETVELTRPLWQRAKIRLTTQLQPVSEVPGNAADLRRVFANLIINAIEAMPAGGQLTLTCLERDQRIVCTVADTGVGIPAQHRGKIFFPYFTTKAQGTGLGLSGAQKIVLGMGGNITFHSEPDKGTRFILELPVRDANQKQRNPAA